MQPLRTSTIIHGFALLHVAAAVFCRLGGVNDELTLTTLTIILSAVLCLRFRQNVEFSAIVIIFVNITGYLLGNGAASLVSLLISHPILAPSIATFATTEIIGWGLVFFMKNYAERRTTKYRATPLETTWLIAAIAMILLVRIVIRLFSSTLFEGESVFSAVTSFGDNSFILLSLIGVTILFEERYRKKEARMTSIQNGFRLVLFLITVSAIAAIMACLGLPYHLSGKVTGRRFLELLLIAIVIEAMVYSVIYMIEYAITTRRKAEKEKDRADLAKFQYLNLKQQVNPHFLFNSLNILDSLVINGQDEEASTFIHKLAGIYRYMLKNEEESTVTLRDEMTYVGMYCDLLKVRFQEGFNVDVRIREEDLSRCVIPCSIQLLVENATKHNSVTPGEPLGVEIYTDGESLTVVNNLIPRVTRSQSSGIGLNYIRQQYEERSGKEIEIVRTDTTYKVKLPLL